jgi:hypothetical protein
MLKNPMAKHKKIQSQTGYFHVAVTTKHKDVNAMLNSDHIYYASKIIHTMQNHYKNPTTHLQYNSLNSHTIMTDILQIKSKRKLIISKTN